MTVKSMSMCRSGMRWTGRTWLRLAAAAALTLGMGLAVANKAEAGYATMVVDGTTGEILNQVNADALNHPASLTKMMTMYLAFQALRDGRLKMYQPLPVSAWAAGKSPTKLNLQPGETVTVHDCVLGMITKSANDAATVVAESLGGSENGFAQMMNAEARRLGMTNTHFDNASGLPAPYQVTTARDLVKLSMALYRDFPQYFPMFATREFEFRGETIHGHNRLMYRYAGMDGLKTGFTNASGFNLASTAVRNNHRLFGVVMGGRSAPARDNLMATLLDNGFAHRTTDPILVAAAGGADTRSASRLMAALSPVGTAEAATMPPSRHHGRAKPIAARVTHVRAVAPAHAAWAIQVGSFHNRNEAQHAAQGAVRLAHLAGKGTQILKSTPHGFRARLTGFSQGEARVACERLAHKGQACTILPPARSVKVASE